MRTHGNPNWSVLICHLACKGVKDCGLLCCLWAKQHHIVVARSEEHVTHVECLSDLRSRNQKRLGLLARVGKAGSVALLVDKVPLKPLKVVVNIED